MQGTRHEESCLVLFLVDYSPGYPEETGDPKQSPVQSLCLERVNISFTSAVLGEGPSEKSSDSDLTLGGASIESASSHVTRGSDSSRHTARMKAKSDGTTTTLGVERQTGEQECMGFASHNGQKHRSEANDMISMSTSTIHEIRTKTKIPPIAFFFYLLSETPTRTLPTTV